MSQETRSLSTSTTAAADGEPQPASTTTVTHYQQLGAVLIASLDKFRAGIPLDPVTPEAKAFIRLKRRVPKPFVTAAVGSLTLSAELQSVNQFSADDSNDDAQFIDGLTPVYMNLLMLTQAVGTTIESREARMATRAQKIYAVARALALDKSAPEILPHVENMKRARKANRPKASKGANKPAPPATVSTVEGGAAA